MKKQFWILMSLLLLIISCGKKSSTTTNSETTPVDTIQPKKENNDVSWNGKYSNDQGDLTITNYKSGSGFDFTISIVVNTEGDEPCSGDVNGNAGLTDNDHATYNIDTKENGRCDLKFTRKGNNEITVEEVECAYFHGAECMFDGTYKK